MYRIDDPSASATLPVPEAALTEGYWTEGNPGSGIPATLERASWFNMIQEELRAIVVAGGLTPSKTTYNQVLQSIQKIAAGRLLAIRLITSTQTYVPTTGTNNCFVRVQAGGGAGGGCPSTATGNTAAGLGGSAGAYGEGYYPVASLTGQALTIGAAGASASGAPGGSGGNSSIGSLVVAPGGSGGGAGQNLTPPWLLGETGNSSIAAGGNIVNASGPSGGAAFSINTSAIISGRGGNSPFGAGGNSKGNVTSGGSPATGPGAGGSGAVLPSAVATAAAGGNGAAGVIEIWEFA